MRRFLSRRARRKIKRDSEAGKLHNSVRTYSESDMKRIIEGKANEDLSGFDIGGKTLIIPGKTLTDKESFVCSIHCTECEECLKESKPLPARDFLKSWGSIFATAPVAGAKFQRTKGCECWDAEKGEGAQVAIKVFATSIKKFVDVIMRNPARRDYTIEKIKIK